MGARFITVLKDNVILILILSFVFVLRTVCVIHSALPSGDEINTYIGNAQSFVQTNKLPPLYDHPGVSIIYSLIIRMIDMFAVTISGVIASGVVFICSGLISVYFVYRIFEKIYNSRHGLIACAILAVFPGFLFAPIRGDLSLYLALITIFQYLLVTLSVKPSFRTALMAGIVGGVFYLCRSDGEIVSILSILLFLVYFPKQWKIWMTILASFILIICIYQTVYRIQNSAWSSGSSARAIEAFYQAEGLHDGKGGSWQDYSARGLDKFGTADKYDNNMLKLVWANRQSVYERAITNARLLAAYYKKSFITPWWLLIIISLGIFLSKTSIKNSLLLIVPPLMASFLYFAFYFQKTYFALISYPTALFIIGSLLAITDYFKDKGRDKVSVLIIVFMTCWLSVMSIVLLPERSRTNRHRYWKALVRLKTVSTCDGAGVFSCDFEGSKAIYLYIDYKLPVVSEGELADLDYAGIRTKLMNAGIRYVFAFKERKTIWNLPPEYAEIYFHNSKDNVRIYKLKADK